MLLIQEIKEKCSASLWIVPALMGVLGAATFFLTVQFDIHEYLGTDFLREIETNPDSLSVTVGTLLAAVITVFGILLPMTISIIMRASGQHTPMVLRTYRSAFPPKFFIGFVLFVTIYLILSLLFLNFMDADQYNFQIVTVDFALVVISLFTIPKFLDYLVQSLEPSYLASLLYEKLQVLVESNSCKEEGVKPNELPSVQDRSKLSPDQYQFEIYSEEEGYLQSVDIPKLVGICEKENLVVGIPYRAGEFVLHRSGVIRVQSAGAVAKEITDKMLQCFHFGSERVPIIDMEIVVDKLVYIQLKALSPGVNDLSTAVECLNFIGASCNLVLTHPFKEGVYRDEEGEVRVYAKEFDFRGFVECAFERVVPILDEHISLKKHALRLLNDLARNCPNKKRSSVFMDIADRIKSQSGQHRDSDELTAIPD